LTSSVFLLHPPTRRESFVLFSYNKEFLFFVVVEFLSVLGIASAFMGDGI
jgi:hypothetical protein